MKTLHLNPLFKPSNNPEVAFESKTFSGGEPHFRLLASVKQETVLVTHRINSFNDFGLLLMAIDALKRAEVYKIKVFIPYFPAARQDRVMVDGEALSVKVYADILNALQLDEVFIFDPHSDVTPALLQNCTVLPNFELVENALQQIPEKNVVLISPDGGALKKIYKVSEFLGGLEVVECSKKRDVKTQALSGFMVYDENLLGKTGIIVDDICDGGRTFMGLAQALKAKGMEKIYLVVSHGIFSYGIAELQQHFAGIFASNSFQNQPKGVTEIRLMIKD